MIKQLLNAGGVMYFTNNELGSLLRPPGAWAKILYLIISLSTATGVTGDKNQPAGQWMNVGRKERHWNNKLGKNAL